MEIFEDNIVKNNATLEVFHQGVQTHEDCGTSERISAFNDDQVETIHRVFNYNLFSSTD